MPIVGNKPYAALAQSRTDMFTACVRTSTFLMAWSSSVGFLDPMDAADFMITIQLLALANNIVTQLAPILIPMLFSLIVLLMTLGKRLIVGVVKGTEKKQTPLYAGGYEVGDRVRSTTDLSPIR